LSEVSFEPQKLLEGIKSEDGEGIMLKAIEGRYSPGKRSWAWQKVKVFATYDVVVTGCDAEPTKWTVRPGHVGRDGVFYPEGKPSSTMLAGYVGLTYGWYMDGRLKQAGKLGYTGPKEELERLVGRVAEVKGYGVYKTGAIRHPGVLRFRDDKRPEECVFTPDMATL
jgi:ATP-dependent DNA ligase